MGSQIAVKEKTNPKLAFCYSLGEVGSQISWYMINNYLTLFYTDVVGLTASAISLIMLIARVWDAVNDPMMGMIADRTHTRWGKFRPYLMFAPPFLAVFNILTFTVFPVQGAMKAILCLICYIGTGMLYTVCTTGYGSMVNVIAKDSQVRMNLSTARGIGSSVIGIILSACVMPMILFFGKSNTANATGYFWTTVVCSIVLIPAFWICAWGCKEKYTKELHGNASNEKMSIGASLKGLVKNDQLTMVILCTLLGTIAVTGRMGMLSYYVIYVVGSYTMIAPLYTSMTIGQLLGNFLVPWGTKKFGKKNYLIMVQGLMLVGFVVMFLFPLNNTVYLLGISFIIGMTNSASSICFGLVSDSIEYGDWKLGIRQEGLASSYLGLSVKLATAVCGAAGVLLLSAFGYVPNAEQTEAAKQGINIVVNIIPAVCGFISLIPLFFYKLSNTKVAQIRAELDERAASKKCE